MELGFYRLEEIIDLRTSMRTISLRFGYRSARVSVPAPRNPWRSFVLVTFVSMVPAGAATAHAQTWGSREFLRGVEPLQVRVDIEGERFTQAFGLDAAFIAERVERWLTDAYIMVSQDVTEPAPRRMVIVDMQDLLAVPRATIEFEIGSSRPNAMLVARLNVTEAGIDGYAYAASVEVEQAFRDGDNWVLAVTWGIRAIEVVAESAARDGMLTTLYEQVTRFVRELERVRQESSSVQ